MQYTAQSTQTIPVPVIAVSIQELELRQALDLKGAQIDELMNAVAIQKEMIQQLRDEIAILKGLNPKPKIKPSQLEGSKKKHDWHKRFQRDFKNGKPIQFSSWIQFSLSSEISLRLDCFKVIANATHSFQTRAIKISLLAKVIIKKVKRIGKRGQPKGKPRKKKKTLLKIHDKPVIQPESIPEGAVFKGYRPYTVQNIIFEPYNTQYQIAQYMLPDGTYIRGELPKGIHGHYGPELIAYILHQTHTCRVVEPLLLKQLIARGVLISAGQLSDILINNKDVFHEEVKELLSAAVKADGQIQVDDTGGRHKGKNQYTTVIGNKFFSFFATTESKSRVNFLELLQQGEKEYLINEDTVGYLRGVDGASYLPGYVAFSIGDKFTTLAEWELFLEERNITQTKEIRFVTEAALYASVIANDIPRDLGVHADDAGQFDTFVRSLCWIHEERHYRKLIMTTDQARADLERVKNQIWTIYQNLKNFKEFPDPEIIEAIKNQFDEIFQQETSSPTLNHQLKKTCQKKQELLRVLQRPETPLHNNSSETDARSAKTKLKVSGGTRSDAGRNARDTFLSLQQTCLKLGINFIDYLQDRVCGLYVIPRLAEVILQRSTVADTGPPA